MINPTNFYTIQGWMLSDLELKGNALAAYAIIYGFSQDGSSEFTGSANYLAEWMGCSRSTVMDTLKKLVDAGLLSKRDINQNGVKFCAYKANPRPCPKSGQGVSEIQTGGCPKSGQGVSENRTGGRPEPGHNNIADNTEISNIKYIVEYLNKKAGKKFKPTSKDTRQHIRARLAEGYKLPDFEQVIDKRCAVWKGDPKMEEFLRPSTLFGPKFESYLNAPAPAPARPAGRGGYGAPAGNIGPNGIAIDNTKTDLDGLF